MIVIIDDTNRWEGMEDSFDQRVGDRCVFMKSSKASDFFQNEEFGRQEKLVVCIHACYQGDFTKPSTYRDSQGLAQLTELIRATRVETRILIYSDLGYPADIFIEELKADNFMGEGINFAQKLVDFAKENGDVTLDELAQRGRTIGDAYGRRLGKQIIIREREGSIEGD